MRLALSFFAALFFLSSLHSHQNIDNYLQYLEKYPQTLGPMASYQKGEIEIILDKAKMIEIEHTFQRKVGIVAEDKYWIWLNDAVRFPNGTYGIYGRLIWRCSLDGPAGVAILPVLPNGKIALNRNFRHATRSWEYELPRGALNSNETPENAARRELKEETGLIADHVDCLGYMHPDSGMTNTSAPVYLVQVFKKENATPEDSEAIASIDAFTIEELKEGFRQGYLMANIDGKQTKVNLQDPFLAFALLQWELRK